MEIISKKGFDYTGEALVLTTFEDSKTEDVEIIDKQIENQISAAIKNGEFTGKQNQTLLIRTGGKSLPKKILVMGLGKKDDLTLDTVRQISGRAGVILRDLGIKELAISFRTFEKTKVQLSKASQACVEGIVLGTYRFLQLKTQELEEIKNKYIEKVTILSNNTNETNEGIRVGLILSNATNFTRDINNNPSNSGTPTKLANVAKELTKNKIKCKIIDVKEAEELGMGSFLSVAKGSDEPAKFIILEWEPKENLETIAIVGKGITFDSGGISLKPAKDMEKMKYDKSGGCAVLGIMKAVSELNLPLHVVGIIPATENLPGGHATKPGDVVKSMAGIMIEVINTDAEGRLVLADGLAYALKYKPKAIFDLATLTGACVIALGSHAAGMMGNDSNIMKKVREAGELTHERVWELPMWKEYHEAIKSTVADIKNVGNGEAGTIAGAVFLQKFVGSTPWVHLDIAGTAWNEKEKPYYALGATGYGVRLITQVLVDWNKK